MKNEEYLLFEAKASLAEAILVWAEVITASLQVSSGECKTNAEAPICLSLGRRILGGQFSSFLNIASHHKVNSGVADGAILIFSK